MPLTARSVWPFSDGSPVAKAGRQRSQISPSSRSELNPGISSRLSGQKIQFARSPTYGSRAQGNRQGVSSTSVPGKLAAANSRRLTLSRGRSASGGWTPASVESDRPIEPKAPHFEDRSSSSSIRDWSHHQVCDLLSSSWIFRSSCLCFENTANELPAATPATSAWTRGLAAKARLPVRSFERPAALQKTSPTEQPEHPAGALTASFPAHGRRRRS